MAEQKQGHQFEPTYSSSMRIRGVAQMRGGEKWSGISVLMARQVDDEMTTVGWFGSVLIGLLV